MDIQKLIDKLYANFGYDWQDLYYMLLEKGYNHEEAICITYNKLFLE
jgi:hypothetical protein